LNNKQFPDENSDQKMENFVSDNPFSFEDLIKKNNNNYISRENFTNSSKINSHCLSKDYLDVINGKFIGRNQQNQKKVNNREISSLYKKKQIRFYYFAICFFVIVNLVITLVDNELAVIKLTKFYNNSDNLPLYSNKKSIETSFHTDRMSSVDNILRIINLGIILIIDLFLIMIYKNELRVQKYYCYCTTEDNLYSSGLWKSLLIEILVLSVFTPPFTYIHFNFNLFELRYIYTLNSFIAFLSIFKLYVVFKCYALFSKWTNFDNMPICNKYFGKPSVSFIFKATFTQYPFKLIVIFFILSMSYLSLLLNFFNIGLFIGNDLSGYSKTSEDLYTSFWVILETCVTLGYGEIITPKTFLTRLIAIISALTGWTCISFLILFAREVLELDAEENNSYIRYKKLEIEDKTNNQASKVIWTLIQFHMVLINKEHKIPDFLFYNKNYQIDFFLKKFKASLNFNSENFIYKTKDSLKFEEDIKKIPHFFLRFYNKFMSFNEVNQACISFNKSMNILKSFSPSSSEEMSRVSKTIDKNFGKLKEYITSKFKSIRNDIDKLSTDTKDFNNKMRKIIEIQKKITDYYVKINNEISEENYDESWFNIIKKTEHHPKTKVNSNDLRLSETRVHSHKY
jgi:hypothetical protein